MDYPQNPLSASPALPSSGRSSSVHSADSYRSKSIGDHLAAHQPSPEDETDPPPFVPSPDDRISLNQFHGGRGALYAREVNAMDARNPRLYRRSTSSIQYELRDNHESLRTYRRYFEQRYRGRLRTKERRRRRRPTSVPGKKAVQLPPGAPMPSPADGSLRASESSEMVHRVGAKPSRQLNHDAITYYSGLQNLTWTNMHPSVPIPYEIRLRRASERPADLANRRTSLPGPRPAPVRQILGDTAHQSSNKGSLAGEALTQAYVHMYLPNDESEERRSSTSEGSRRLSATLQVVRSRDSVYEVIWEDIAAITDASSSPSSSSSSSPGIQFSSHLPYFSHSRPNHIKTTLAGWSWGGELGPYSKEKQPQNLGQPSKRRRPSLRKRLTEGKIDHRADRNTLHSPRFESGEESVHRSNQTGDLAEAGDNIPSRRNSVPSKLPRPSPNPSFRTHLTIKQRSELLGNRKLSNLPPEEEHFTSHRDSLILAHERISFNNRAVSRVQDNAQFEKLKQSTCRKPKIQYVSQLHAQSSPLRQNPLEPRTLLSSNTAVESKMPRSKHSMTRKKRQREAAGFQNADG